MFNLEFGLFNIKVFSAGDVTWVWKCLLKIKYEFVLQLTHFLWNKYPEQFGKTKLQTFSSQFQILVPIDHKTPVSAHHSGNHFWFSLPQQAAFSHRVPSWSSINLLKHIYLELSFCFWDLCLQIPSGKCLTFLNFNFPSLKYLYKIFPTWKIIIQQSYIHQ